MRQARTVLSTYSGDTFGVCSALYELGGMIVMHDASGCNSTYTTHDEPRWYHSDSMVFISGLTEMDAILGNDDQIEKDMISAINDYHPTFSAIAGTPIPMMNGFDYEAVAIRIEQETGIPCLGFNTNGMRSYLCGASEALAALAERFTKNTSDKRSNSVNVLGATPLDFSLSGTVPSIREWLANNGWEVISCWAMDSGLEDLERAGEAQVNLVISSTGLKAAQVLQRKFGTPYVIGTPCDIGTLNDVRGDGQDNRFCKRILECLTKAQLEAVNCISFENTRPDEQTRFFIIGESVISRSLAASVNDKYGVTPKVINPLEILPETRDILSRQDINAMEEEEIQKLTEQAELVIADPLYEPILPKTCRFISLPHEAFSGRMYRKNIPNLMSINININT